MYPNAQSKHLIRRSEHPFANIHRSGSGDVKAQRKTPRSVWQSMLGKEARSAPGTRAGRGRSDDLSSLDGMSIVVNRSLLE